MTIWLTNQASANTTTPTVAVRKSRAFSVPVNVSGLSPVSKYTFYYNTIDCSWACRQSGQKMGDDLISDTQGKLSFQFFVELNNEMSSSTNLIKTHSFQLKDIAGNVKAIGRLEQNLTIRK